MTTKRRRFLVTVEGVEDADRPPVLNRFRWWLKKGWREFGLRCITGHEIEDKGQDAENEPDPREKP